MALSAYALIVQDGSESAHKAGRAYLSFTVVGEALLLAGLLVGATGQAGAASGASVSQWATLGTGLLLLAFGIKIGAAGLGGWMPAAYSAAPAGAGAAIAGVVSSAGVLGLIRFMPGGVSDLPGWGSLVMAFGLLAAFGAAAIGCLQREPRHVLAYSSMSQFGLMTVGIGAGLATAEAWPAAIAAVAVYLVHHGFAKAALFAGEDALRAGVARRLTRWAMLLPALALAGLPLTSGAIAKVALKGVAAEAPPAWAHILEILLPIAAFGTTLLVARFIILSWRVGDGAKVSPDGRRRTLAFGILWAFVAALLWVIGFEPASYAAHKSLTAPYLVVLAWPVVAGLVIAAAAWRLRRGVPARSFAHVRPGDVWAPIIDAADGAWMAYRERLSVSVPAPDAGPVEGPPSLMERLLAVSSRTESSLLTWPVASGAVVTLALLVLILAR
jgi:formate hydrogenlyase subunit 3/multisubunit Na+/H+ antiporter MnhD subunit